MHAHTYIRIQYIHASIHTYILTYFGIIILICIHKYMHSILAYIHTDVYVCMLVYVCMYMYACICMHVYVCMYVYVCSYVCMYVCMYVYVCVCIHLYVCMHNILGELSGGEMSSPKREGELSGGVIVRGELSGGIVSRG